MVGVGSAMNSDFESLLNYLTSFGIFPTDYPVLATLSFGLASIAWMVRGDKVSALIFGFAILLPFYWVNHIASGIEDAWEYGPDYLRVEMPLLYLEMAVVIAMFAGCTFVSVRAMARKAPLRRPEFAAGALIAAHTLHVHLAYSIFYMAASMPIWATYLMRVLR